MGQSSDELRQEIDQKRSEAAEKIDRIQAQAQDTSTQIRDQIREGSEQVQDTAQHIREQVQGTVEDSVETAKHAIENVDLHQQVQQRPLMSVGAAFIGGMVLGKIMSGGGDSHDHGNGNHSYTPPGTTGYSSSPASSSGGISHSLRNAIEKSGLEETISNAAAALIGNAGEQLRATLDNSFPGFADKLQAVQHSDGSIVDKAKAAAAPEPAAQ
jgi:ElaB/YqjD/DUF883 family membrane-anchored ribosome-binding protein